jgi:hypothetical protein
MDDPLTQKIQQARHERDDAVAQRDACQRRVEIADARLQALEQAAELRPLASSVPRTPVIRGGGFGATAQMAAGGGGHKGRQPGAISKNWKSILLAMTLRHPAGATEQDIVGIAQDEGIDDLKNLRPRDAARQMRKYQELGYVEKAHALLGTWRITEAACRRFNIDISATIREEAKATADSESAVASDLSSAQRD